ncbi:MAG: hypothetical protein FJW35_16410, partial [Acidobacteria bacterium]|nr:hypothetical protein [Acidobacteriota bacterium]
MDSHLMDPEAREALATYRRYLDDSIPPLEAVESVSILLSRPAGFMVEEIAGWAAAQHREGGQGAPISDLFFHSLKKLQLMSELRLVSGESLAPYIAAVKSLIVECCPREERGSLEQRLSLLSTAETELSRAAKVLHYPKTPEGTPEGGAELGTPGTEAEPSAVPDLAHRSKGLALSLERLQRDAASEGTVGKEDAERREELLSRLLAIAARRADNASEIEQVRQSLRSLGIDSSPRRIFRKLGFQLGEWHGQKTRVEGPAGEAQPLSPLLDAMRRLIRLSPDGREGARRLQELVGAAIELFNGGSLRRAAAMIELAQGLLADGLVEHSTVRYACRTGHEQIAAERLRGYAEQERNYPLLKTVIGFFEAYRPEALLANLETETGRSRRRLVLSLLEVHGEGIRPLIVQRLESCLEQGDCADNWYFPRNLVYLLQRIPRGPGSEHGQELELMGRLLNPDLPLPLVREAVGCLAHIPDRRSEELLVGFLAGLEQALREPAAEPQDPGNLNSLLDRVIFALRMLGTPSALKTAAAHCLQGSPELGDAATRLACLSSVDLSADPEIVAGITRAIRAALPR